MEVPIWVLFVAAGIITSAFMAIKTGKEEHREEMEMIQREGQVFMERLEKEKETRNENIRSYES